MMNAVQILTDNLPGNVIINMYSAVLLLVIISTGRS